MKLFVLVLDWILLVNIHFCLNIISQTFEIVMVFFCRVLMPTGKTIGVLSMGLWSYFTQYQYWYRWDFATTESIWSTCLDWAWLQVQLSIPLYTHKQMPTVVWQPICQTCSTSTIAWVPVQEGWVQERWVHIGMSISVSSRMFKYRGNPLINLFVGGEGIFKILVG